MKKILVAISVLLIGCIVNVAYAEEELTDRFSIGVVTGGVFPKDSSIDNSLYIGGNLAYGFNKYLAIGVETGYTSWDDKEAGIDYGDVRAVPLLADLYVRYPMELLEKTVVPYGIGGIGVVFWDYEESSVLKDNNISVNMDPELGVKVGGGVDFFLTKNIALNFEGAYLWSDADVSVSAFGTYASTTIDTDAWLLNAGLKYYF